MVGQKLLIILYYCFSKNQIAPQEHPVGRRFALVCRSLHPPVDLTRLRTLVVPAPEDTLELGVALQRPDADGGREGTTISIIWSAWAHSRDSDLH